MIGFDTETHLIAPGVRAPKLVCGTVADGEQVLLLDATDTVRVFREILRGEEHFGGTNIVFDLAVMCRADPSLVALIFNAIDAGRVWSTDLLEALHDNARGCLLLDPNTRQTFSRYSQGLLEARYLGADRSADKYDANAWRLRYSELDGVPLSQWPTEAQEYPKRDAEGARWLLEIQTGPDRETNAHALEMAAAWGLALACTWGMRTDPAMVADVSGRIREEHSRTREHFFAAGLTRVQRCGRDEEPDPLLTVEWLEAHAPDELLRRAQAGGLRYRFATNTAALAARVEAAYGASTPLTDSGRVSTARDTCVESGDPLLEEWGEAGENEKLYSTYLSVLEQGTRTAINPEVQSLLASGRASYRKPNLQQLPRAGGIRECFVPRAGRVYVSCDYAAGELCTLSQVCVWTVGFSDMADAINAGRDLHLQLAARVAGITYEDAQARRKVKDKAIGDLRQAAKAVNFGLPGLMGVPKLVLTSRKQGVRFCELSGQSADCRQNPKTTEWRGRTISPTCGVCLELAEQYRTAWFDSWREMSQYHAWAQRQMPNLVSFGNGMRRFEESAGAACNHYFQNLLAQGAKLALYLIAKEQYADSSSVLYGHSNTVAFLHDETLCEVDEAHLTACAMRQSELMVSGLQQLVPDVKISCEPAAMRRWFKGAEAVWRDDGQLVPWWPKEWSWAADQEQMRKDQGGA